MLKILQSYVDVAYLLKIAKLTDEQYRKLFSDLKLRNELHKDNNLTDQFEKAMPLLTERQIDTELENIDKRKQADLLKLTNDTTKIFLEKYGNLAINDFVDRYIRQRKEHATEGEAWTDDVFDSLDYSANRGLKYFIEDYLFITRDNVTVDKFIKAFDRLMNTNKENIAEIEKITNFIGKLFYDMNLYMVSIDSVDLSVKENFINAKKIRETDIFDFLFQTQ